MFLLFPFVASHGFMIGLTDCSTGKILGKIRDYSDISIFIDNIRNPSNNFCRNAEIEGDTPYTPKENKICIALAISNNAEHVGPCSLEFVSNSGSTIKIGSLSQCISQSKKVSCDVPDLVTGDMCRYDSFFNTEGLVLPSGNGFFRWNWIAQHLSPSENYENCMDVNISNTKNVTGTVRKPKKKKCKWIRKKICDF